MGCINMDGDNDTLAVVSKAGILEVTEKQLKEKYGEDNLPLLTKFELTGLERAMVVELNPQAVATCRQSTDPDKVSQRQ